jgi:hypothetical protein
MVSEVCSKQINADKYFMNLFKNADTGSLFLFVDNCSGYASNWFDRVVGEYNHSESYSLRCIRKLDRHSFQMEYGEQVGDLEPYYSKYCDAGVPKRSAPVDVRIYRKV